MKRFLFTLLLSGALWSAHAQTAYDPFLDVSYARTMNTRISGGHQATPSFVTDVISSLGQQQNSTLVGFLNHFYGYPVWDRSEVFTAYGNQTALTPMVFLDGNSITGILISVNQNGVMHYGIMDLSHLFPFAADVDPGTPGMPGARDVLAHFAYFNHELFGEVDCNIIQALYALAPKDSHRQEEDLPKSCYYNIMSTTTCWHMYGVMPGGEQIYLYSECSTSYNWILTCLNPGGGFGSTGGPSGGPGGPGGPGGGGSNTEITELDNEDDEACAGLDSEVHKCSAFFKRQIVTNTRANACFITIRLAGCSFGDCDVFTQAEGTMGCGFRFGLSRVTLNYVIEIENMHCVSYLTNIISYDPLCNVSTRCGAAYLVFDVVLSVAGIPTTLESVTLDLSDICYSCRNCPN